MSDFSTTMNGNGFGGNGPSPAGGAGADLIKDGSIETFEQDVLATSMQVPVIVDFWAPWCGPCKQLTPALEKAVTEAGGKVRLVKIDIDQNKMLASQLRIQSVPTIYAFVQGQPVDGFQGAVPESEIKAFIQRITSLPGTGQAPTGEPSVEDMLAVAGEAFNAGDVASAAQVFAQIAQSDPENLQAIAGLARCYVATGEVEQATAVLDSVPADKKSDPAITAIQAAIDLTISGADAGNVGPLAATVEAEPDNHAARFDLAEAMIGNNDLQGAMDQLLLLMEKNREWNEEAARKKLLTVFEALGPTDELVKAGRKRMSSILFS